MSISNRAHYNVVIPFDANEWVLLGTLSAFHNSLMGIGFTKAQANTILTNLGIIFDTIQTQKFPNNPLTVQQKIRLATYLLILQLNSQVLTIEFENKVFHFQEAVAVSDVKK